MLYKYRAVNDLTLDALAKDKCWFANRYQLNDPYDCYVRLPKAITVGEVRRVVTIAVGRSYIPTGKSPAELLQAIETSTDAFRRLGLIAEYAEDVDLLKLLKDPSSVPGAADLLWLGSYSAVGRFFDATTVFCLSESSTNKVMWGNYADSYRGFCIGYRVRAGHPLAQRLQQVKYTTDWVPVDFGAAVVDPVATRDRAVYSKPSDWSYEKEWRITVAGDPALREAPLELAEVIFGSSMQQRERDVVRQTVAKSGITFRQLRLAPKRGYELTISSA